MDQRKRRVVAKEFLLFVACAALSAIYYFGQVADVGSLVHGTMLFSSCREEAEKLQSKARELQMEAVQMHENRLEDGLYKRDFSAWADQYDEMKGKEKNLWKESSELYDVVDRHPIAWLVVPVLFYPLRFLVVAFIWSVRVLRESPEQVRR